MQLFILISLFQFGKIHLLAADANVKFNYIWLWSIRKIILWGVELQAAIYRNISNNILLVTHFSVICEVVLVNLLDSCIHQLMEYIISDIFLAYKHYWEKKRCIKKRKCRQYHLQVYNTKYSKIYVNPNIFMLIM